MCNSSSLLITSPPGHVPYRTFAHPSYDTKDEILWRLARRELGDLNDLVGSLGQLRIKSSQSYIRSLCLSQGLSAEDGDDGANRREDR